MSPTQPLHLQDLTQWIDKVLEYPEKFHASECLVRIHHNLFALHDFETDPSTGGPVFRPRSECIIHLTPLSAAAYCGNEDAVKQLLEHPNPHDSPDNVWTTPLSLAYVSGNMRIIDLLRRTERDESHTPFTIMHAAARFGSIDYVRKLHCIDHVEMTIRDMDEVTPVIHALFQNDDEKVKNMISAIIEFDSRALDIRDIWVNDWTCADLAQAMGKSEDLVKWLESA